MTAVFIPTGKDDGLYDLVIDGRTREYDVDPWDLLGAVRRARHAGTVYVEDETGHRTTLRR